MNSLRLHESAVTVIFPSLARVVLYPESRIIHQRRQPGPCHSENMIHLKDTAWMSAPNDVALGYVNNSIQHFLGSSERLSKRQFMSSQEIPKYRTLGASSGIAFSIQNPLLRFKSSMWRFINGWPPESRRFVLHRVCIIESFNKHRMQVYYCW